MTAQEIIDRADRVARVAIGAGHATLVSVAPDGIGGAHGHVLTLTYKLLFTPAMREAVCESWPPAWVGWP